MGMFDKFRSEYPLPGNPPEGLEYQTKSLYCNLDTYKLAADGQLWCRPSSDDWDWEALEEMGIAERPEGWDPPPPPTWEKSGYTGEICFYYYPFASDVVQERYDFTAVFLKGKLHWVTATDGDTHDVVLERVVKLLEHVLARGPSEADRKDIEEALRLLGVEP